MSTFSSAPIVIDGKGHLLGRLASIISKQVSWTLDSLVLRVVEGRTRMWNNIRKLSLGIVGSGWNAVCWKRVPDTVVNCTLECQCARDQN